MGGWVGKPWMCGGWVAHATKNDNVPEWTTTPCPWRRRAAPCLLPPTTRRREEEARRESTMTLVLLWVEGWEGGWV